MRDRWQTPGRLRAVQPADRVAVGLAGWLRGPRADVARMAAVLLLIGLPSLLLAVTLVRDQALLGLPPEPVVVSAANARTRVSLAGRCGSRLSGARMGRAAQTGRQSLASHSGGAAGWRARC